jgi:hypothetical protein
LFVDGVHDLFEINPEAAMLLGNQEACHVKKVFFLFENNQLSDGSSIARDIAGSPLILIYGLMVILLPPADGHRAHGSLSGSSRWCG